MAADGGRRQHLLGLILQSEGLISRAQLDAALAEQAKRRDEGRPLPLGAMLEHMKLLGPDQVMWALGLQEHLAVAAEERKRLGFYLLEAGLVRPSQVALALKRQAEKPGPLGEILVEMGALRQAQLGVVLGLQRWDNIADRYTTEG